MRIIILIVLLLVSMLSIVISIPGTSQSEMFLNNNLYNQEYHGRIMMIIRYILMFTISLILIEHDAQFIKPLIAYFKRGKIAFYKLIFYLLIVLWLIIIIYSIVIVIPFVTTSYYQFDINYFKEFIKLIPDYIIMTLLLLILIRDNRKGLSFLILIVFVVITFIQEDNDKIIFGYLIPLSNCKIYEYKLGYFYLICYIMLLVYIYFITFLNENIWFDQDLIKLFAFELLIVYNNIRGKKRSLSPDWFGQ